MTWRATVQGRSQLPRRMLCVGAAPPAQPAFVPVFKVNFPDPFVLAARRPVHRLLDQRRAQRADGDLDRPRPLGVRRAIAAGQAARRPAAARQLGQDRLHLGARSARSSATGICSITPPATAQKNAQCIGVAVAPIRSARSSTTDAGADRLPDRPRRKHRRRCRSATPTASSISISRTTGTASQPHARSGASSSRPTACRCSAAGRADPGRPGLGATLVEAPTMVRSPIGYELFFSGGFFGWNDDQARCRPTRWAMRAAPARSGHAPSRATTRSCTASTTAMPAASAVPGTRASSRSARAASSASTRGRRRAAAARPDDKRYPLYRAVVLEGRQAADRAEPARFGRRARISALTRAQCRAMNSAWVGICSAIWR